MNPLTLGKSYLLRLPNERNLGRVQIRKVDEEWAEGDFQADEAFAELRHFFDEESQLRNDQIIPLWEDAADRLESLHIQVIGEDGQEHSNLRIYIEGDEAFLASPLVMPENPS